MAEIQLTKEERAKKYQTEYKVAHREQHAQYMKKYVAASPSIACPCGGAYKGYCAYRHNKTSKHLKFLETAKAQAEAAKPAEVVAEPIATVDTSLGKLMAEVLAEDFINTEQLGSLLKLQPKKEVAATEVKKSKKIVIQDMFHVAPAEVIAVEPSTPTVSTKRPKPKKTCPAPENVNFVI